MLSSAVSSLGIFTPIFYLAHHLEMEVGVRGDEGGLLLLQLWLGLSTSLGSIISGVITTARFCLSPSPSPRGGRLLQTSNLIGQEV